MRLCELEISSRANPSGPWRPTATSYNQQRTFSAVLHENVRSIGEGGIDDTAELFPPRSYSSRYKKRCRCHAYHPLVARRSGKPCVAVMAVWHRPLLEWRDKMRVPLGCPALIELPGAQSADIVD